MSHTKSIEKNNLFKHSTYVGLVLLLSLGLQLIFSFFIVSFSSSKEGLNDLLTSTWSGYLINTLLCAVIYTFPFLLLQCLNNSPVHEICKFNSPKSKYTLTCILFAFGASLASNFVTEIFNEILKNVFNFEAAQPTIGDNAFSDPLEFLYTLVCSAIAPALIEEFAFRGLIFGSLRKFGDWPAIFVSALLFGIMHGNFIQIPFAFVIGIVLGITVVITDSIWPAIIVHCLNNSYAVILNAVAVEMPLVSVITFYLIISIGVVCLIRLIKNKQFFKIKNQPSSFSYTSRITRLLSSPTVLIFIVFMLIEAYLNKV